MVFFNHINLHYVKEGLSMVQNDPLGLLRGSETGFWKFPVPQRGVPLDDRRKNGPVKPVPQGIEQSLMRHRV